MTDRNSHNPQNGADGETLASTDLAGLGEPNLVYVREVPASEILAESPMPDLDVAPDAIWYAVHAADGARLAVLNDREAAFSAARQHDLKPVSVH